MKKYSSLAKILVAQLKQHGLKKLTKEITKELTTLRRLFQESV